MVLKRVAMGEGAICENEFAEATPSPLPLR
jgi:hypothetical protein